jgi:hypothetical protein
MGFVNSDTMNYFNLIVKIIPKGVTKVVYYLKEWFKGGV